MAAATADNQAPNPPPATRARFAGSLVNAESGEEIAGAPVDVKIVAETRSLECYGTLEDLLYRTMQAAGSDP